MSAWACNSSHSVTSLHLETESYACDNPSKLPTVASACTQEIALQPSQSELTSKLSRGGHLLEGETWDWAGGRLPELLQYRLPFPGRLVPAKLLDYASLPHGRESRPRESFRCPVIKIQPLLHQVYPLLCVNVGIL